MPKSANQNGDWCGIADIFSGYSRIEKILPPTIPPRAMAINSPNPKSFFDSGELGHGKVRFKNYGSLFKVDFARLVQHLFLFFGKIWVPVYCVVWNLEGLVFGFFSI